MARRGRRKFCRNRTIVLVLKALFGVTLMVGNRRLVRVLVLSRIVRLLLLRKVIVVARNGTLNRCRVVTCRSGNRRRFYV